MKRVYTCLLMALIWVMGMGILRAQVVDVCSGGDSVVLRLGNFQYGYVQWQVSDDNELWDDIDGAIDTLYTFLPERPRYYRAELRFPACLDTVSHSQVSYVQVPPKAFAGTDRTIPAGAVVRMQASLTDGATGTWSILSGTGGTIEDIHDCRSGFIGEEGDYTLIWSVSNSCGTDTDTVAITCVPMQFQQDLVIVDETDAILSDSTQQLNGDYIISFNDPVPDIHIGTVLLAYRYPSFLRKVTAVEQNGNMFIMQTEAAALTDVILSGVLNIDPVSDTTSGRGPKVKYLDRFPTRREMQDDPFLMRDGSIYVLRDYSKEVTDFDFNVSLDPQTGLMSIKLPEFDFKKLDNRLDGLKYSTELRIYPNFVADITLPNGNFKDATIGFNNARFELVHGIRLTKSLTTTLIKKEGYFNKKQILAGAFVIPPGIPTFVMIDLPYFFKVQASLQPPMSITKTSGITYTFMMYYNRETGQLTNWKEKGEPYHHTNIERPIGSIAAEFNTGVKASVLIADVFGPYFGVTGNFDPSVCVSSETGDIGGNINMGVDLNIGCRFQLFSHNVTLFDRSFDYRVIDHNEPMPKKVVKMGGDNQIYSFGQYLANPIEVQGKGWFNTPMPLAYVHFVPENGTVSVAKVSTDIHGRASTRWKPGTQYGMDKLQVKVYDCEGNLAGETPVTFRAYSSSTDPCITSNLTLAVREIGQNTIKPQASGGNGGIQYSTNGVNYSTTAPVVQTEPGNNYHFYVRDANGCEAEAWYNAPPENCNNSNLQVGARVDGNTITVMATGGNMLLPYQYSIGGNYQSSPVFSNLYDGEYTVSVRDASGCERSKHVVISRKGNLNITLSAITNGSGTACVTTPTSTLIDRGVCWSTHQSPTVQDFHNNYGPGTGSYSFTLTGLDPNTTYYVRAYALDGSGTSYSPQVCIRPAQGASLPVLAATGVTNVGQLTAVGSGNVTYSGGSAVTQRGICYGTNPNPTTAGAHVVSGSGTGAFSATLVSLTPNQHYYARAYAINSAGTAYGAQAEFTTKPPLNCTITLAANPTNGGTVSGGGTYQQGQTCTVHATPSSGYTFQKWTYQGSQVSTSAHYTFTVTETRHLVAHFVQQAPNTYTITATADPTNGGTVSGAGTYQQGQSCTLTATPATGYRFGSWMRDGVNIAGGATITFTVNANANYVAHFVYNGGGGGNHEYVDLGLPSGLLWATCNVGADTPEGYGDYFAWGETQPKDYYYWSTYQYCNGSNNTLTKYCNNSDFGYNGFTDNLTTLQPEDDAATANWGSGWRMPTKEEFEELYNNTTHTWTTQNGVNGRRFTASNGNSVFLPAAGGRWGGELHNAGSYGYYWSRSLFTVIPYYAWDLSFNSDDCDVNYSIRSNGFSVRPVREN